MGLKRECPADQTCSAWALTYVLDCICTQRDILSFVLGVTSIICWAVSEMPQIVVNWRANNQFESTSLAFVILWMFGDFFNFLGCWINPGTLPTQLYLATLYSVVTIVLVGKQIWYTCTSARSSPHWPAAEALLGYWQSNARPPRRPTDFDDSYDSDLALSPPAVMTQSLPVMSKSGRPRLEVTPSLPTRPYFREPGVYPGSVPVLPTTRSPNTYMAWKRLALSNSYSGSGSGSPLTPRSPIARGLIFSSLSIVGITIVALYPSDGRQGLAQGLLSLFGRGKKELEQKDLAQDFPLTLGLTLGWLMTSIYVAGRVPEIMLNWSRDFIVGASIRTVVFTFLGNTTYLASILVRGVAWSKLNPVLPWVLDTSFCLLMDTVLTCRFVIRHLRDGDTILE